MPTWQGLDRDSRFQSRYIEVRRDGTCALTVPIYFPLVPVTDPAYQLDTGSDQSGTDLALIGGRRDRRLSILWNADLTPAEAEAAAQIGIEAALEESAKHDRRGVLLYVDRAGDSQVCAAAERISGVSVQELPTRYLIFSEAVPPDEYVTRLPKKQRGNLRRELRELQAAGIQAVETTWEAVLDTAPAGIQAVQAHYREPEPAKLIQWRLRRHLLEQGEQLIAFSMPVEDGGTAASLAIVGHDTLEMYELALPGERSPLRQLRYAELAVYAPLRFMCRHNLRILDLGTGAPRPKLLRGGVATEVCGYLFPPQSPSELNQ